MLMISSNHLKWLKIPFYCAFIYCLYPTQGVSDSHYEKLKENSSPNTTVNKKNINDNESQVTASQSMCRCPRLEKEHLTEIYSKGKTYDTFRGYIPHTKRNIAKEARKSIERAVIKKAYKSKEGTCTCWYVVRDSHNGQLDELGLEEYESKQKN